MKNNNDVIIGIKSLSEKIIDNGGNYDKTNIGASKVIKFSSEGRNLNTLVVGPDDDSKEKYVFESVLKQDIENKNVGVTIFDIGESISNTAYGLAKSNRRNILFFNPLWKNARFNPLKGELNIVLRRMSDIMKNYMVDSPQFFIDVNMDVLNNSLKLLKRAFGDNATLQDLSILISNPGGEGRKMVMSFMRSVDSNEQNAYEKRNLSNYFLNEYYNEKSKTFIHSSGLRTMINSIINNEALRHLFDTNETNDIIELEFTTHLKNKDIVIIQLQPMNIGLGTSRILAEMLSQAYASTYLEGQCIEGNNLYIKELYYWQSGFKNLFSNSQHLNLKVMADTNNLSILKINNKNYIDTNLFAEFQNFILMPGLSLLDKSILKNNILNPVEFDSLNFLVDGEVFIYLLDRNVVGYREKGIIKANTLTVEEKEFLEKRLKRYKKEFSKLMN